MNNTTQSQASRTPLSPLICSTSDTPRTDSQPQTWESRTMLASYTTVPKSFAKDLERENAKLRRLLQRACAMLNVSPEVDVSKWPSEDEINEIVKECHDLLSNVESSYA